MSDLTQDQKDRIDAGAFRRLLNHLDTRTDVQNIDLMILADFCRNCLGDWYREAAAEEGVELSKDEARERIYGIPYPDWKMTYQTKATEAQLEAMANRKKTPGKH